MKAYRVALYSGDATATRLLAERFPALWEAKAAAEDELRRCPAHHLACIYDDLGLIAAQVWRQDLAGCEE